jgi:hypothetical protein
MNRWSRKTVLMAGKSSREAFNFKTKPSAPTLIASSKISGQWYEVKNRILEAGATLRICRAASTPLRFGSPMSSKTRSGCNSSLFWTASKPSEHSPIITRSKCFCRSERTARRHARESSTIKIRLRRLEVEDNLNLVPHDEILEKLFHRSRVNASPSGQSTQSAGGIFLI